MPVVNPRVPEGLRDLMKGLTKEVLREKPPNIYEFSAHYFETLLQENKDFIVKEYEPVISYENLFQAKERNQIPVALVFKIIPEGLTELIKEFIKAVLRENPKNLCEFAVEYFRHIKKVGNIKDGRIQYTAYENYFSNNERFVFTPYVKCTCGRTFGEGLAQAKEINKNHFAKKDKAKPPMQKSLAKISAVSAIKLDNSTKSESDRTAEESKPSPVVTLKTESIEITTKVYDERYVTAIYVIQRFFKRCLRKHKTLKTSTTTQNGVETSSSSQMSEEAAAIIIQRSLRKLFTQKFHKDEKSYTSLVPHLENIQQLDDHNDNVSEAASYTSASTVQMSAESAGEATEREILEMDGGAIVSEEQAVIIHRIEEDGEQQNESAAAKPNKVTSAKITNSLDGKVVGIIATPLIMGQIETKIVNSNKTKSAVNENDEGQMENNTPHTKRDSLQLNQELTQENNKENLKISHEVENQETNDKKTTNSDENHEEFDDKKNTENANLNPKSKSVEENDDTQNFETNVTYIKANTLTNVKETDNEMIDASLNGTKADKDESERKLDAEDEAQLSEVPKEVLENVALKTSPLLSESLEENKTHKIKKSEKDITAENFSEKDKVDDINGIEEATVTKEKKSPTKLETLETFKDVGKTESDSFEEATSQKSQENIHNAEKMNLLAQREEKNDGNKIEIETISADMKTTEDELKDIKIVNNSTENLSTEDLKESEVKLSEESNIAVINDTILDEASNKQNSEAKKESKHADNESIEALASLIKDRFFNDNIDSEGAQQKTAEETDNDSEIDENVAAIEEEHIRVDCKQKAEVLLTADENAKIASKNEEQNIGTSVENLGFSVSENTSNNEQIIKNAELQLEAQKFQPKNPANSTANTDEAETQQHGKNIANFTEDIKEALENVVLKTSPLLTESLVENKTSETKKSEEYITEGNFSEKDKVDDINAVEEATVIKDKEALGTSDIANKESTKHAEQHKIEKQKSNTDEAKISEKNDLMKSEVLEEKTKDKETIGSRDIANEESTIYENNEIVKEILEKQKSEEEEEEEEKISEKNLEVLQEKLSAGDTKDSLNKNKTDEKKTTNMEENQSLNERNKQIVDTEQTEEKTQNLEKGLVLESSKEDSSNKESKDSRAANYSETNKKDTIDAEDLKEKLAIDSKTVNVINETQESTPEPLKNVFEATIAKSNDMKTVDEEPKNSEASEEHNDLSQTTTEAVKFETSHIQKPDDKKEERVDDDSIGHLLKTDKLEDSTDHLIEDREKERRVNVVEATIEKSNDMKTVNEEANRTDDSEEHNALAQPVSEGDKFEISLIQKTDHKKAESIDDTLEKLADSADSTKNRKIDTSNVESNSEGDNIRIRRDTEAVVTNPTDNLTKEELRNNEIDVELPENITNVSNSSQTKSLELTDKDLVGKSNDNQNLDSAIKEKDVLVVNPSQTTLLELAEESIKEETNNNESPDSAINKNAVDYERKIIGNVVDLSQTALSELAEKGVIEESNDIANLDSAFKKNAEDHKDLNEISHAEKSTDDITNVVRNIDETVQTANNIQISTKPKTAESNEQIELLEEKVEQKVTEMITLDDATTTIAKVIDMNIMNPTRVNEQLPKADDHKLHIDNDNSSAQKTDPNDFEQTDQNVDAENQTSVTNGSNTVTAFQVNEKEITKTEENGTFLTSMNSMDDVKKSKDLTTINESKTENVEEHQKKNTQETFFELKSKDSTDLADITETNDNLQEKNDVENKDIIEYVNPEKPTLKEILQYQEQPAVKHVENLQENVFEHADADTIVPVTKALESNMAESSVAENQNEAAAKPQEKERTATYLYGIHTPRNTPTLGRKNLHKAATTFTISFDDQKPDEQAGLEISNNKNIVTDVKDNIESSREVETADKPDGALYTKNSSEELKELSTLYKVLLENDSNADSEIEAESPTKLFAELNLIEDAKLDATITAEEAALLRNNDIIDKNQQHEMKLNVESESRDSTPSTPDGILKTIVEINENEHHLESKITTELTYKQNMSEPFDPLEFGSNSDNESDLTSSWTCSKETDENVFSDEFLNENTNDDNEHYRRRRSSIITITGDDAIQGGIYEMEPSNNALVHEHEQLTEKSLDDRAISNSLITIKDQSETKNLSEDKELKGSLFIDNRGTSNENKQTVGAESRQEEALLPDSSNASTEASQEDAEIIRISSPMKHQLSASSSTNVNNTALRSDDKSYDEIFSAESPKTVNQEQIDSVKPQSSNLMQGNNQIITEQHLDNLTMEKTDQNINNSKQELTETKDDGAKTFSASQLNQEAIIKALNATLTNIAATPEGLESAGKALIVAKDNAAKLAQLEQESAGIPSTQTEQSIKLHTDDINNNSSAYNENDHKANAADPQKDHEEKLQELTYIERVKSNNSNPMKEVVKNELSGNSKPDVIDKVNVINITKLELDKSQNNEAKINSQLVEEQSIKVDSEASEKLIDISPQKIISVENIQNFKDTANPLGTTLTKNTANSAKENLIDLKHGNITQFWEQVNPIPNQIVEKSTKSMSNVMDNNSDNNVIDKRSQIDTEDNNPKSSNLLPDDKSLHETGSTITTSAEIKKSHDLVHEVHDKKSDDHENLKERAEALDAAFTKNSAMPENAENEHETSTLKKTITPTNYSPKHHSTKISLKVETSLDEKNNSKSEKETSQELDTPAVEELSKHTKTVKNFAAPDLNDSEAFTQDKQNFKETPKALDATFVKDTLKSESAEVQHEISALEESIASTNYSPTLKVNTPLGEKNNSQDLITKAVEERSKTSKTAEDRINLGAKTQDSKELAKALDATFIKNVSTAEIGTVDHEKSDSEDQSTKLNVKADISIDGKRNSKTKVESSKELNTQHIEEKSKTVEDQISSHMKPQDKQISSVPAKALDATFIKNISTTERANLEHEMSTMEKLITATSNSPMDQSTKLTSKVDKSMDEKSNSKSEVEIPQVFETKVSEKQSEKTKTVENLIGLDMKPQDKKISNEPAKALDATFIKNISTAERANLEHEMATMEELITAIKNLPAAQSTEATLNTDKSIGEKSHSKAGVKSSQEHETKVAENKKTAEDFARTDLNKSKDKLDFKETAKPLDATFTTLESAEFEQETLEEPVNPAHKLLMNKSENQTTEKDNFLDKQKCINTSNSDMEKPHNFDSNDQVLKEQLRKTKAIENLSSSELMKSEVDDKEILEGTVEALDGTFTKNISTTERANLAHEMSTMEELISAIKNQPAAQPTEKAFKTEKSMAEKSNSKAEVKISQELETKVAEEHSENTKTAEDFARTNLIKSKDKLAFKETAKPLDATFTTLESAEFEQETLEEPVNPAYKLLMNKSENQTTKKDNLLDKESCSNTSISDMEKPHNVDSSDQVLKEQLRKTRTIEPYSSSELLKSEVDDKETAEALGGTFTRNISTPNSAEVSTLKKSITLTNNTPTEQTTNDKTKIEKSTLKITKPENVSSKKDDSETKKVTEEKTIIETPNLINLNGKFDDENNLIEAARVSFTKNAITAENAGILNESSIQATKLKTSVLATDEGTKLLSDSDINSEATKKDYQLTKNEPSKDNQNIINDHIPQEEITNTLESLNSEDNLHILLNNVNDNLEKAAKSFDETFIQPKQEDLEFVEKTITELKADALKLTELEELIAQAPSPPTSEPTSVGLNDTKEYQDDAATTIQKHYKGYRVRKLKKLNETLKPSKFDVKENSKETLDAASTEKTAKTELAEPLNKTTNNSKDDISQVEENVVPISNSSIDQPTKANDFSVKDERKIILNKAKAAFIIQKAYRKYVRNNSRNAEEASVSKENTEKDLEETTKFINAAQIIQRVYRNYKANKMASTKIPHMTHTTSAEEIASTTGNSLDGSQITVILNENYQSELNAVKSVENLEHDIKKKRSIVFIEPTAPPIEHHSAPPHEESTKVNWFVGEEPIVRSTSGANITNALVMDHSQVDVDNSHKDACNSNNSNSTVEHEKTSGISFMQAKLVDGTSSLFEPAKQLLTNTISTLSTSDEIVSAAAEHSVAEETVDNSLTALETPNVELETAYGQYQANIKNAADMPEVQEDTSNTKTGKLKEDTKELEEAAAEHKDKKEDTDVSVEADIPEQQKESTNNKQHSEDGNNEESKVGTAKLPKSVEGKPSQELEKPLSAEKVFIIEESSDFENWHAGESFEDTKDMEKKENIEDLTDSDKANIEQTTHFFEAEQAISKIDKAQNDANENPTATTSIQSADSLEAMKNLTQFINLERKYWESDKANIEQKTHLFEAEQAISKNDKAQTDADENPKATTSIQSADSLETMKNLTQFINLERKYWESDIPYTKLEEPCTKKSIYLVEPVDEGEVDDAQRAESSLSDIRPTTADFDAETEQSSTDSLESMTKKLRDADVAIERMQQRRASTARSNSNDDGKITHEQSFDEPVIKSMQELQENRSSELEDEEAAVVLHHLQREDTRESSAQSDAVVFGANKSAANQFEYEFEDTPLMKISLQRVHTIAGDDPKSLFKSVTIDDTVQYIEPPECDTTATSGSSFCLDDDDIVSENIRKKMMAYSLSEADSDFFENDAGDVTTRMGGKQKLHKDDFNISTALVDLAGTSTETESTIVSATTKIQAGARGFLTRKRLRRTSGGTKSTLPDNSKASFGNAAISESLERLIEDEAAKKIQNAYRRHYRQKDLKSSAAGEKDATKRQRTNADDEEDAHVLLSFESTLAARRLTLQRGDALRNDSTPDEENGNGNGKALKNMSNESENELKQKTQAVVEQSVDKISATEGSNLESDSMHTREGSEGIASSASFEEEQIIESQQSKDVPTLMASVEDKSIEDVLDKSSTSALTAADANNKKKIDNELKWISHRQNSMPVQIEESEVFRVIPKHMRKRIKSAEPQKKKHLRVLRD